MIAQNGSCTRVTCLAPTLAENVEARWSHSSTGLGWSGLRYFEGRDEMITWSSWDEDFYLLQRSGTAGAHYSPSPTSCSPSGFPALRLAGAAMRCQAVRGLPLGSGIALKLCSTRLGYLWLEAARPGPHQAEGEPPDEEGVNSACHDRFPNLERVLSFRFHHAAEGENERPEWSVGRWVPASFLPCHNVEVFPNKFGGPFAHRVVLGGYRG
jgi:hypothetical protein